jgi:GcrA cell cycle regulator
MIEKKPTWTAERIELLKAGFEAGQSCRQIADDIGVSRNAVIGKLSRLKLTRQASTDARSSANNDAEKQRRPRKFPRLHYPMLQTLSAESLSAESWSAESLSAAPQPDLDDSSINRDHRCSLLELNVQRCRWPISTPGAADFCFCGNLPVEGLPYCAGHTRLAYRPGSRHRVAPR